MAVLSLALGLGLVTTMVALLDAATHPWVPYRDAGRLYDVRYWVSSRDQRFSPAWVVSALRQRTRAFETIQPYGAGRVTLGPEGAGGDAEPEVTVARVPPRLFATLGIRPARGRLLDPTDFGRGAAVVSDAFWRARFPGRRGLAGASVALGGHRYAIVGVMPSGMTFPSNASVWLPLPDSVTMGGDVASVMVKLKPGVSRQGADVELAAVASYLTRTYQMARAPFAFYLAPLRADPMRLSDLNWAMLGAAVVVLLIACANLANLMLARGFAKRREVALRLAIGASRGAVVRQMFAECALLTLAGAAIGVALSLWGVAILKGSVPRDVWWLGIMRPRLSWRVFALAALAASGAAVLFGLLPAIRVARAVSLDEPLKDGAGTTGRTRQRYSALVISEVALALVLLMGAGLLLKVVHRIASYQHSSTARLLLRSGIFLSKPAEGGSTDLLGQELAVIAAVRTVPGVADAAAMSGAAPPGGALSSEVATDTTGVISTLGYEVVTPSFLRTLGVPIVAGRDFEDGDLTGDGAVIVNTVAAALLYPHGPAVGRMLKLGAATRAAPWQRIVGVARAVVEGPPGTQPGPDVWVVRRLDPGKRLASVLIRTVREDPHVTAAVAMKLATMGPGVGRWVFPYLAGWEAELRSRGFVARLFALMGAFALLLAAVGIYGVLAYAVNRRIREFAVRIAVGAERADMLKLVLHDGLVMTLAGTGVGAFVALWAMGLLARYLEGQQVLPSDVLTLIAAELVLITVATLATLAPAFRAMRADPIAILRAT